MKMGICWKTLSSRRLRWYTVKLSCVAYARLLGTPTLLPCKCRLVQVQSLCPNDQGGACR